MWGVSGNDITMAEGDWGIELPIGISGVTFSASDALKLTVKSRKNGAVFLEKTYTDIENNTIRLTLTKAESEALGVGSYVYCLDWYQDGAFLCNIIPFADFGVVDKV